MSMINANKGKQYVNLQCFLYDIDILSKKCVIYDVVPWRCGKNDVR